MAELFLEIGGGVSREQLNQIIAAAVNPRVGDIRTTALDLERESGGRFLLCDGRSLVPEAYPELYEAVKLQFGGELDLSVTVPVQQSRSLTSSDTYSVMRPMTKDGRIETGKFVIGHCCWTQPTQLFRPGGSVWNENTASASNHNTVYFPLTQKWYCTDVSSGAVYEYAGDIAVGNYGNSVIANLKAGDGALWGLEYDWCDDQELLYWNKHSVVVINAGDAYGVTTKEPAGLLRIVKLKGRYYGLFEDQKLRSSENLEDWTEVPGYPGAGMRVYPDALSFLEDRIAVAESISGKVTGHVYDGENWVDRIVVPTTQPICRHPALGGLYVCGYYFSTDCKTWVSKQMSIPLTWNTGGYVTGAVSAPAGSSEYAFGDITKRAAFSTSVRAYYSGRGYGINAVEAVLTTKSFSLPADWTGTTNITNNRSVDNSPVMYIKAMEG